MSLKKSFFLSAAALLCLSLSACSPDNTADNKIPQSPTTPTAQSTPEQVNTEKVKVDEKLSKAIAHQPNADKKELTKSGYYRHQGQKITEGVSNGDEWQYIVMNDDAYKTFVNNNPSWFSQDFNSKAWGTRQAPMGNVIKTGNSELDPATQISWNGNSNNLLLRRVFNVEDPTLYKNTTMNVFYNNDMEVYVNNVLVYSDKGKAKKATDSYTPVKFDKAPIIVKGDNIISIHLKATDKNKEFDMSLTKADPQKVQPGPPSKDDKNTKAQANTKNKGADSTKAATKK